MKILFEKLQDLRLFLTTEYRCSYLPNRMARNLVADPEEASHRLLSQLTTLGFRRSGGYIYQPYCTRCDACLSLRIPVADFRPSRSQRRAWKRNRDLEVIRLPLRYDPEHYQLFVRYLKHRHRNGGMDDYTPDSYRSIIASEWSHTVLHEVRSGRRLFAVAVVDELEDGLSSVYTYFDPEEDHRSLGTFTVLWQINEALHRDLRWVYLGYWVQACRKMTYKANFNPHEVFVGGRWISRAP
jgi:arginine-tRNA-protein transferase